MKVRQEILEKTLELIMKYGIRSVSMDDISKSIGISKKTIYLHFENKKDLIREVVISRIEKDEKEILEISVNTPTAIDEILGIAKHALQFLRGMSSSVVFDMKKYYSQEWSLVENHHSSFLYQVIQKNIKRGIAEGTYLEDTKEDVIAKVFVMMINCLADEDIFPLSEYKRDEIYKSMIIYHIRGLVSENGRAVIKTIVLD